MPTKAEMEILNTTMPVEAGDDIMQQIKNLKPIEGLDIEKFANQLSTKINKPEEYSGLITGFFKRWKLERETKAVDLFYAYLEKLRTASDSAAQLQETIIKNRIIFLFQAQFAQERLKQQWNVEKRGYQYQLALMDMKIAKQKFFQTFFETTDPSSLSETALILLSMVTERSTSSSATLDGSSQSVQYGSPQDVAGVFMQEKYMEMFMNEKMAEIDIKKAEAKFTGSKGRQEDLKADDMDRKLKKKKKQDEEV